jgi:hypothetical protein
MNDIQLRFLLFIFGCIGTRLVITILSALVSLKVLKLIGILALIPVLGWFFIIFIGKRDTGLEVGGGKIWWKHLRPIHMIFWAFFSLLAISGNKNAWIVLLTDTLFGLGAFLHHHWSEGNFHFLIKSDQK